MIRRSHFRLGCASPATAILAAALCTVVSLYNCHHTVDHQNHHHRRRSLQEGTAAADFSPLRTIISSLQSTNQPQQGHDDKDGETEDILTHIAWLMSFPNR
jgi:hypothetical protein